MATARPDPAAIAVRDVQAALAEDIGAGDMLGGLAGDQPLRARIVTRTPCVLAGHAWCDTALAATAGDCDWQCSWSRPEGARAEAGATVAVITAPADALLAAERTALNFIALLSGVATAARRLVDAAGGVPVYDTRKTLPGLRLAQKHAAEVGGMARNRAGLFDAAIIKDSHIAAAGSVAQALERARQHCDEADIQVEVADMAELEQALKAQAGRIMLDNFSVARARDAVRSCGGRAELEASGGITAANAGAYAATGVDRLSSSEPTKRPVPVDLSLVVEG